MKTKLPCSKCGVTLMQYYLIDGVCNGCRNPHLVVESISTAKGQFKTIDQVWNAIDKGLSVFCSSSAYQLTVEDATIGRFETVQYWKKHHSYRNGKMLRVTCISNYFGSLLGEKELSELFVQNIQI